MFGSSEKTLKQISGWNNKTFSFDPTLVLQSNPNLCERPNFQTSFRVGTQTAALKIHGGNSLYVCRSDAVEKIPRSWLVLGACRDAAGG